MARRQQLDEISEVTRRSIFDAIQMAGKQWCGRLDEVEFLSRIFDLNSLPSTDGRYSNMAGDVRQHRIRNYDWDESWVFFDNRLDLLFGSDETLLRFLCEIIHPLVRSDEEEIDELLRTFNRHLARDGFQISAVNQVSGRRLFAAPRALPGLHGGIIGARAIADELSSEHVSAQITRMQTNIDADPALAIGTARQFLESLCKAILDARGMTRTGREDFPQLASMTRNVLSLKVNPKADVTLKSLIGALGTITNAISELRGQMGTGHGGTLDTERPPAAVDRLAVGAATAFGTFLWEMHRALPGPPSKPWFQAQDHDPI